MDNSPVVAMKKAAILCLFATLPMVSCTTRTITQYGNGMLPGIGHGDRIIYTTAFDSLGYGDVVIFKFPGDEELIYPLGPTALRVVGLPGDTIAVKEFICVLGGVANECRFLRTLREEEEKARMFGRTGLEAYSIVDDYEETFPNGHRITIRRYGSELYDGFPDSPPEVVPPGHYFLMGDFRGHALDSRTEGAIPAGRIIGKVVKVKEQ